MSMPQLPFQYDVAVSPVAPFKIAAGPIGFGASESEPSPLPQPADTSTRATTTRARASFDEKMVTRIRPFWEDGSDCKKGRVSAK